MSKLYPASLLVSLSIALASPAFAGGKHDHARDHAPAHGGVVALIDGHLDLELVAQPDRLQLYLRNEGRPLATNRASARITLLTGSTRQLAELKPAGNRLEASGQYTLASGSKAVIQLTLPGKPATTTRLVLP